MKSGQNWRPRGRIYAAGILGLSIACGLVTLAHRGGAYTGPGATERPTAPIPATASRAPQPGQPAVPSGKAVLAVSTPKPVLQGPDSAVARVQASSNRLPLTFEANLGQTDKSVKFISRGPGYNLFLTADEAVLALRPSAQNGKEDQNSPSAGAVPKSEPPAPAVLRMKLLDGNPAPAVSGADELPGKSNYLVGNDPNQWRRDVPTFAKVKLQDVYPGVDLIYYGRQNQLEYDFVVSPGADPNRIALKIETLRADAGMKSYSETPVSIDANGDLVIGTKGGEVRFNKPYLYQTIRGAEQSVAGRFVMKGVQTVGFEVGAYDPTQTLIIDPALTYATYLGGAADDIGTGIGVDASGNTYLVGTTGSVNFPTVTTPYQAANGGSLDVFVAKLEPDGSGLIYSTYLGGRGSDRATGMYLNAAGNVYVTGYTTSDNFPTTSGALKTTYGGGSAEAFIVEMNSTGSGLVFSTYLGGTGADYAQAITVDAGGNVFVAGSTQSVDFPTASPLQAASAGNGDAFVSKLNPTGTSLISSTYLGGGAADFAQGIALDSGGNVIVTGYTYSTDFPTASPLQAASAGSIDAFVTKINAAGSALLYSTYLGGSDSDRTMAVAVDASDNVLVTGETSSLDFPTTAGAYQTAHHGNGDAFVTKLNAAGTGLLFSTYLGGVDTERGNALAVGSAPSGNVFVTGHTRSDDFPTAHPFQGSFGGGTCNLLPCSDAFVTALDSAGSSLIYSSYLGGDGSDHGQALTVDSAGVAYVTGAAASALLPTTMGVVQPDIGGAGPSGDAFIVKISPLDEPAFSMRPRGTLTFEDQPSGTTSEAQTITLTNTGSAALGISSIAITGPFTQTNTCGSTLGPEGAQCTIQVSFAPTSVADLTGTLTITHTAAGSPNAVNLAGKGTTPVPLITLSPTSLDFGSVLFETTSAPQNVTVTNTGSADLTISSITLIGDFAQTNDCPTTPLAPGEYCTIAVTFTPTATLERVGTVSVTNNADGSPHKVSLTGMGLAEFTLGITPAAPFVDRDATSATFTISMTAPETFTSSVTLSCTETYTAATCTFNPTSITRTETSTLTLTPLKSETSSTLDVTVAGTGASQTAKVTGTITFTDFSISAAPPLREIVSGDTTTYTLTVTPLNTFAREVSLSCYNPARDSTCTIAPSSVTLDGVNPSTATVTVTTTTFVPGTSHLGPRPGPPPTGGVRWPWIGGAFILLLAAHRLLRRQRRVWVRLAAPLAALLLFVALLSACTTYYYDLGVRPKIDTSKGTHQDNYTLILTGTFGELSHSTSTLMSVR